MILTITRIVNVIVQLITIIVIIKVFLSYFMPPYHLVRLVIDRIVNPMLRPLQRVIPPIGMLDISPLILIVIVQILGRLIITLLIRVFP